MIYFKEEMMEIKEKLTIEQELVKGEMIKLPTKVGFFSLIPFQVGVNGMEHIALIKGEPKKGDAILTRIHSACATGDLFGSMRCDCGDQLKRSMEIIEEEGTGVILYLQQEGRGIGLMNKIKAYKLQEEGMDTVDANIHLGFAPDERDYGVAAAILKELDVNKLRLLTNNPAKVNGLTENGIEVIERVPLIINSNVYNAYYLETKEARMGHCLTVKMQ
ncbi:GTP cyclohydrolase II [Marinilabiliaceae bacterium JC017]|nr:GTP cyclohydrolase II [Marinilabiliaceae bacterium JC017]